MLDADIQRELSRPLDPRRVSVLRDGPAKGVPYLEAHEVVRRANEVFGFGAWGYSLVDRPFLVEAADNYELWAAVVRLDVTGGQSVTDVGTCVRSGKGQNGLDMAFKGAVSDGVKRCLKAYGDQFGLILADKSVGEPDIERWWREDQEQHQRPPVYSEPPEREPIVATPPAAQQPAEQEPDDRFTDATLAREEAARVLWKAVNDALRDTYRGVKPDHIAAVLQSPFSRDNLVAHLAKHGVSWTSVLDKAAKVRDAQAQPASAGR